MTEVLRQIPKANHPDLLVGFETGDDAGVIALSAEQALVQTVDFFTPVVDDPRSYGQIAAANALSDIYAMGGRPITALNICCFDPQMAPPEVWAAILLGMAEKTAESGAILLGGHTVSDREPKFGMAVTGMVHPAKMFTNAAASPGDKIYMSKPLGVGIITTAIKQGVASEESAAAAIASMSALNRDACQAGLDAGVKCATDITGFGLVGHLWAVARASGVRIAIEAKRLPVLPDVEEFIAAGCVTGGAANNRQHLGVGFSAGDVPGWLEELAFDPQTSGGLALFSSTPIPGMDEIGVVTAGPPGIRLH